MESQRARELLEPIEHIVVLMLENRSFDHMLGYLGLPEYALESHGELPVEVDGLQHPIPNPHGDGPPYQAGPLDEQAFLHRKVDPPHDLTHVRTQVAGGAMTGFVDALSGSLRSKGRPADAEDPTALRFVMDYVTREHVPVYDHLARNFCVCDHWFCSVPGPTLLNRFYSVTGTIAGAKSNNELLIDHFGKLHSFFRYLDPKSWRWYSSDPGILRVVDSEYTFDDALDHFAYFDQLTEAQPRSFLRDVLGDSERKPELPAVSWIDPNFNMKDVTGISGLDGPASNDDHPPMPVILGQKLVHKVYRALGESPFWDSCLLVVIYDEHGGFFDHVTPPSGRGPRVPALLVSPHVKRGVLSVPFDHASLIKTILLRFGAPDSIGEMPASVAAAADLSVALREDGVAVPFSAVPDPGGAAIQPGDLEPAFLPNDGSTLARTLSFADANLSDLQKDIVLGIAIPLRTGYRFLRRARKWSFLKWITPLFRVLPKRERLKPRRP